MPTPVDFLARVLPNDGSYFYATEKPTYTDRKSRFNQASAVNLQDLIAGTNNKDKNTYFATASYSSTTSREAPYVKLKKSFYIDVDVGPDKAYKDIPEAIEALKEFLRATGLPMPTTIISSGGGVHLYWILDTAINGEQWLRVAGALKNACIKEAFAADHVCTTDLTRVMRVPGTNNVKEKDNPRACKILRMESADTTLQAVSGAVAKYGVAPVVSAVPDMVVTLIDGIPECGEDDLGTVPEYQKAFAKYLLPECLALNSMVETGGANVSEPGWMHALGILAYCEDGDEYIHAISEQHHTYSKQRTELKYQKRVQVKEAGKYGPPLCKTLGQENPGACAQCPHNGRVNTPLTLGREPKDGSVIPFPYYQENLTIMRKANVAAGEDEPVLVCEFAIKDVELAEVEEGYAISFTGVTGSGERNFWAPMGEMSDQRGVVKLLNTQRLLLKNNLSRGFIELMQSWSQQLEGAAKSRQGHTRFGWVKDGANWGFVTGNATHWEHMPPATSMMRNPTLLRQYKATGDLTKWKQAADLVIKAGEPSLVVIMASAFAAPLMQFTPQTGGVLSAASNKSGTGKTSTAKVSQSVWGDPIHGLNSIDDTDNAILKRAGLIGSLPIYMDELRGDKVPGFIKNVIFRVTQGKEKARLKSSTDFQTTGTWNSLMTVTSNERLVDHIEQYIHSSDAGHRRVLEFDVPVGTQFKASDSYIIDNVDDNYGLAGEIYAEYLVANRAKIADMVKQVDLKLKTLANVGADGRFWTAIAATLIVGATIAKSLGLVDFDVKALKSSLISKIGASGYHAERVASGNSGVTIRDVVADYMETRAKSMIKCDVLPNGSNMPEYTYFMGDPRSLVSPIAGMVSTQGSVILAVKELREFMVKKNYMWGDFRDTIASTGQGSTSVRYNLSESYEGTNFPTECIKFDMTELEAL